MNTVPSYFEDTYKFETSSVITGSGKDERGPFVILDQTIFYPQGGGQPSDKGSISVNGTDVKVLSVKCIDDEIRHYTDQDCSSLVGQTALCAIDQELRLLHARLHTSGHLIANIVETLYPNWIAIKGHHFPDQPYVEFTSKKDIQNIFLDVANQEIKKNIEQNSATQIKQINANELKTLCPHMTIGYIPNDQPIRVIRIGGFPFSPCGGTHVKSLNELKGLEITKFKIKNNNMKINYSLNRLS